MAAEISRAKDAQLGAAAYLQQAQASNDFRRIRVGRVYEEYTRRLFAANAMDFDDLIANTVKLLQEQEDVRAYWQRRFQYVLVDEYQDTNHLQYLLASTLAGGWGNICVVGDDDQSIYKPGSARAPPSRTSSPSRASFPSAAPSAWSRITAAPATSWTRPTA